MEGFTLLLLFILLLLLLNNIADSAARDTIDTLQSLIDGDTIVSADETFAMGFFSPGSSKNRYVGIWYNKIPTITAVWVANRDKPLNDTTGELKLNANGILIVLNHNKSVIWSSNTTKPAQYPVATLLNSGNLVVHESSNSGTEEDSLWQSFDYPGDTLLPGQKFGRNLITGLNRYLTSWNSSDDPSPGKFSYQVDIDGYPQIVLREGTSKRFRFGSWNGVQFSGAPQLKQNSIFRFKFVYNEKEAYYVYELINSSVFHRLMLTPNGFSYRGTWSGEKIGWTTFAHLPVDDCDYYSKCEAYASCNINNFPVCDCLDRFVHDTSNSSGGNCVRRTSLSCNGDGFLKFSKLKLPDTETSWFSRNMSIEDCKMMCLKNCSCSAYAALEISNGARGCLLWFGDLMDMKELTESNEDIYIRMAGTELDAIEEKKSDKSKSNNSKQKAIIIISCGLSSAVLVPCLAFIFYRWKARHKSRSMKDNPRRETSAANDHQHEGDHLELPLFDMSTITSATNNFATDNMIGEGGFGSVYKGILQDGREIAVKRLSRNSNQGLQEFKNEVMHIAKLQHRNLVRLLGSCIEAGERLLVYEFMPNKSLDIIIFDKMNSILLDWPRRLNIINGIARGLLYLHQDSRYKIVHRDLKAANILLDIEMNPKISDFGLARSFGGNETEANTNHVVGTYGYLSPEYVIDGVYSTKSDVFSFGVLILEIMSGKRNRGFCHEDHNFNLLGHAWRLFTEGNGSEIVYAPMRDTLNLSAMLRAIHVGLLCVQQSPDERPNMSSVVLMLSSEFALPQPKTPGFFTEREVLAERSSSQSYAPCSVNDITVSLMQAR